MCDGHLYFYLHAKTAIYNVITSRSLRLNYFAHHQQMNQAHQRIQGRDFPLFNVDGTGNHQEEVIGQITCLSKMVMDIFIHMNVTYDITIALYGMSKTFQYFDNYYYYYLCEWNVQKVVLQGYSLRIIETCSMIFPLASMFR